MGNKVFGINVSGRVQGVGYRYFVKGTADKMGITGWVMNLPDGDVGMEASGEKGKIDAFIKEITRKDGYFRVTDIKIEERNSDKGYKGFSIRHY